MTDFQAKVKEKFECMGYSVRVAYSFLVCSKKSLSFDVVVAPSGYVAQVKKGLWTI